MSVKAKRRKSQAEPGPSNEVLTITDSAADPKKLFYIVEDELRAWLNWQCDENVEAVIRLAKSLCDLLNHRWNTSMRATMLMQYLRCLAKHGIPFHTERQHRQGRFLSSEEFTGKFVPVRNLKRFFQDLSDLEFKMRSSIWAYHNISIGSTRLGEIAPLASWKSANISRLRYQLCIASRHLNYRAVVSNLANSEILRMTTEIIEKGRDGYRDRQYNIQNLIYFDSPIAIWMALQATLSMKHDSSFDMGNRLVLLAAIQNMVYTTNAAKNTILMQMCEFLIATILCGNPTHVAAVVALENSVNRYNKSYENAAVWNAYKLIAEYEEWRGRAGFGGMILSTAQSLFEVAESMPSRATLFVETACRIWAKQGRCEEKIAEAVSRVVNQCPQLLGRMTRFLRAIDFDHEIEIVVDEVCGMKNTTLSPSDPAWLDWCQSCIERPERHGKREEVLSRCVDILFRFLDYGSNRGSARAWVLLHAVVQLVNPRLFIPIWAQRYDWWPRFHVVPLPAEAESRRAELLAALAETPVE
nr:Unknown [Haemonchus contortus]